MAERTADVQDHWTRPGVLSRIDAALTELGHDPQNLTPDILATVEHLHSGGLATTRDQAERITLTPQSKVLDIGCGTGGPARYLAHTYGCEVDGVDLTPELIETGKVLTERCGLSDRVRLQLGNALELPYPDQTFDVVWCQNVTMNIADKAGFLVSVHHVLKPGGLFTATEYSLGEGDIIFPLPWAYDASINFLDTEEVMRAHYRTAGFRIREWINYSDTVIKSYEKTLSAPPNKLTNKLVFGEDTPDRQRNSQRNLVERRIIYWMIVAERAKA